MAHQTKPRLGESTTTVGTGPFALDGALTAHKRFSAECSVADTFWGNIAAVDSSGNETGDWVEGLCTYSAANEVTVTTVYKSSNSNLAVTFGAGTKYVTLIADARQVSVAPRGGTTGQALVKASGADYDGTWGDVASSAATTTFTPAGGISATNVQSAIQELDTEKTSAAIVPDTAPAAGEILVGNAGGTAYAKQAVSGDVTITSAGVTAIGSGKVTEAMQVLADNTTNNVSTTKHGYAPKAPNDATKFLDGTGAYSTPAGSSGLTIGTTTITSGTSTRVLFDDGGVVGEDSAFTWDKTNNVLTIAQGTITTSQPQAITATWNDAAVTFTGWKLNITSTASAAASILMDLQVGGTSVWKVDKAGLQTVDVAANSKWLSLQYASSEYVRIGFNSTGYGMFSGAAIGGNNGFLIGASPSVQASGDFSIGTNSASFSTFNNGSNTTPYLTLAAVGLTTKPGLRIDQSAATTASPITVRLNSNVVWSMGPNGEQTFTEQTAPSAPAANGVTLYAVDNGAGKTQLMALFSSGAAQQLALQP